MASHSWTRTEWNIWIRRCTCPQVRWDKMTVCLLVSAVIPQTSASWSTYGHVLPIFVLSVGDFACLEWPPSVGCDVFCGGNACIRSALFQLLTVSSMLMNLRNILNDVSLNRKTLKITHWSADTNVKTRVSWEPYLVFPTGAMVP